MASVYEKAGKWYMRVKDAGGRWRDKVTHARTKTEARRMADELERRAERQRLGLEARPLNDGGGALTVEEVVRWYCDMYLKDRPSYEPTMRALRIHIAPAIGHLPVGELTAARIETWLQGKAQALGPQTLNHLRGYLLRALNKARKAGKWTGENPALMVDTRRVPRRQYDYLRAEEVPRLMAALGPELRPLFAVAIYTGLRKGELLALRKEDVDLEARLLTVACSYDRDTTKGNRADVIPIAEEAVPYLQEAIAASPSDLLFPAPDGTMRRRDFKAQAILQRALGRAGIVSGWKLVCRRKGCGYHEEAAEAEAKRCPRCTMRLWPKPRPRRLRFHDLRGTCASLLIQSGASPAAVAAVLRHTDPNLTMRRYAHMDPGYLRQEINRLSFGPMPGMRPRSLAPSWGEEGRAEGEPRPFAASLLHGAPGPGNTKAGSPKFPQELPAFTTERRTGFEPATPSLGSSCSTS
jgi:integrase